jgi:hypothetical protein
LLDFASSRFIVSVVGKCGFLWIFVENKPDKW